MTTIRNIFGAALGLLLLAGCGKSREREQFELALGKPVPASLANLRCEGDIRASDPTCHLCFSANTNDMLALLQRQNFQNTKESEVGGEHPAWWRLDELGTNRTFYAVRKARTLECFWLSASGTNACYLFLGM